MAFGALHRVLTPTKCATAFSCRQKATTWDQRTGIVVLKTEVAIMGGGLSGRDLSAEKLKQGLALDWSWYSDGKYRHLESSDARKKLFLADARQKGRMYARKSFEARQGRQD
jgi:hypothetical protein